LLVVNTAQLIGKEFEMNGLSLKVVAGVVVVFLMVALAPFGTVPAGYRGVMTTFGSPSAEVLSEGIHFRVPLAQKLNLVNVSIQKGEGDGDAASRDLQTVHTRIALNYHVKPESAVSVFRDLGNEPGTRIIIPSVQEAVKAVTARFTAEELIAKRTDVRDEIVAQLRERLARHGILVDEFSIVNFNFSRSFNEAIEAKTTAEQLKLKAERDLQRIEVEAKQRVAQAKAEAESLALQRQQVTPELIQLRQMENQRMAIEKWDGKLPNVAGGAVPFINVK
jgi:regulator of protease activity HflC (stomatin/prohibitin superfamily)